MQVTWWYKVMLYAGYRAPPIAWVSGDPKLWVTWGQELSLGSMMTSVSLLWCLFLIVVAGYEAFDHNGLHLACLYGIWISEVGLSQCHCGPVWMKYHKVHYLESSHNILCTSYPFSWLYWSTEELRVFYWIELGAVPSTLPQWHCERVSLVCASSLPS